MAGKKASGGRVQSAATFLYAADVATTSSYADVEFTVDGNTESAIECDFAISLEVEAEAATQDVNIKVLTRAHFSMPWRELQAETGVTTAGGNQSVYSGTVRGSQIKVQIKEGASSGGTAKIAVTLK